MADTTDLVSVNLVRADVIQAIGDYRVGPKELARLAGVHRTLIQRVVAGKPGARITRASAGKILEVILQLQFGETEVAKPRPAGAQVVGRGHQRTWTHCAHGHEYTEANLYINGKGKRECRLCNNRTRKAYNDRKKARGQET